jgi:mRNA-degrading endonuclease HigB of HigAB toxin-antitoxin module
VQINQIRADASLLYAIQRTTKESSADILSYFYKIIDELHQSALKSQARVPNRNIKSMYPNTGIPYQLEVYISSYRTGGEKKELYVYITFPKNQMFIKNLDTLMREIAETSLLGSELPRVPDFEAPKLKAPRGKKYLINE